MSPYISGECCVPETSGEVHLYMDMYMDMDMGPAVLVSERAEGWPSKNRGAAILACCALSRNHGAPRLAL